MESFEKVVSVLGPNEALSWYPSESDSYLEIDMPALPHLSLPEGSTLPVRGRDWSGPYDTTDWEYGYAIKEKKGDHDTLWFVYEDGFAIDIINFVDLVQPAKIVVDKTELLLGPPIDVDPKKVIILSHGWSEKVGPNYPLIRTLERVGTFRGWKVIVPDFRQTYSYGHNRGRSERVRTIYSEMLCLDPRPDILVLVGHSQGGAASSFACENRVVLAQKIKGLLLIGTENPISMDGMDWVPHVPHTCFIHSDGDQVVWPIEVESLARRWDVPFIKLEPKAKKDDIIEKPDTPDGHVDIDKEKEKGGKGKEKDGKGKDKKHVDNDKEKEKGGKGKEKDGKGKDKELVDIDKGKGGKEKGKEKEKDKGKERDKK